MQEDSEGEGGREGGRERQRDKRVLQGEARGMGVNERGLTSALVFACVRQREVQQEGIVQINEKKNIHLGKKQREYSSVYTEAKESLKSPMTYETIRWRAP